VIRERIKEKESLVFETLATRVIKSLGMSSHLVT